MAVINQLGRNSSAITYPNNSGSEQWPTFATIDKWLRDDTLQGTGTASGTTVTGTNNTIFNTQLRAGDSVMIAGQLRIVQSVSSDTAFTVTQAFSPAITAPSSIRLISYTMLGTANNTTIGTGYYGFSNIISGTVSVTNDVNSSIVTGIGTYFLSELTNSVVETVALAGTVAVDTSGNITGTGTSFATGVDGSLNRLQPGDSIRVGPSNYFTVATVTSDTAATVTVPPGSAITAGASVYKATNGGAGRTIVINGRVRTIASIVSNTQLTLTAPMDLFDSNLKVKTYPRGTVGVAAGSAAIISGNVSGANFYWDLPTVSQVWIGDELRTFTVTGKDTATLSDPAGYTGGSLNGLFRQAVSTVQFKKDDTLIAYVGSGGMVLSQELRVGDDIIVNGTECTVTQIISDTLFRVGQDMPTIPALSTIYKKKKLHGYVLEGTREGNTAQGKFTTQTYITSAAPMGATQITVNAFTTATYNFIKIQNAGGPPVMLTGSVTVSGSSVSGSSTKFTSELHVGAEVCIGGVYGIVQSIASDISFTLTASFPAIASATPLYRTVPLYTYITPGGTGNTYFLGTPLRNSIGISSLSATQSVIVSCPAVSAGTAEFIEFVYSAPNKSAEASVTLTNQSLDRKYFGLRYFPMLGTGTFATADAGYNLVVYERWVASYAQTGGVGINIAHLSDNGSNVSGVNDRTTLAMSKGGFIYLFAKPRYFLLQGKSFLNTPSAWLGCIEFERAQPEDVGTGLGTTAAGVSYFSSISPTGTPNISPWPCFAYFHSDRFPVGAGQVPTAPTTFASYGVNTNGIHGSIFACPRVHLSSGDITGISAHVYSACTITTGRWGHLIEQGGTGAYATPGTVGAANGILTSTTAGAFPMPHLGHLVPVNSNVYNSKRFMFSPVVVMGPAYDPDIRGRIFGLKVIPSALGSLMDTVSVTVDTVNDFYDSTAPATDHWVITSPGNSVTTSNTGVLTYRFTLCAAGTPHASAQYRSIEDGTASAVSASPTQFVNNFRFAIPA